jgi:hypothetical protein
VRMGSGENYGVRRIKIQTYNITLCAPDELHSKECESLPSLAIIETLGIQSIAKPSMDWEDIKSEVGRRVGAGGFSPS